MAVLSETLPEEQPRHDDGADFARGSRRFHWESMLRSFYPRELHMDDLAVLVGLHQVHLAAT